MSLWHDTLSGCADAIELLQNRKAIAVTRYRSYDRAGRLS